jgi:hydrogenase maturation factor
MNLTYGEVTELFTENGMQMGTVRVSGAVKKVPLDLLTSVQCGDRVLLCDGVAISKVADTAAENNVSRDSR